MLNVMKLDLDRLLKHIQYYKEKNANTPKYIVMSQDTLDLIKYHSGINTLVKQAGIPSEVCDIKVAINNTLKLGVVDII